MYFTENTYEQAIIELLQGMGYTHIYAPDMARDYTSPILEGTLLDCLVQINKGLPIEAIKEAIAKLKDFESGSIVQKNAVFMGYLQDGVEVKYFNRGEERSAIVKLIDYAKVKNNTFEAVNQFTFIEDGNNRRPDIVLFVNGLPLVVMELKSPSKDEVGAENAYNQIRNYIHDIPSMFVYNAFCVISDLTTNKAGTITSGFDRFMEWKTKDGSYENTAYAQFDTFYEGLFEQARLLDIIKNFICFSESNHQLNKIMAGYHQYFAVRKAVDKAVVATATDGKGGVFWHTQGSGKSLSMVFYAHLLQEVLDSPTIVVMTDRIDLDDQLYMQFSKCSKFLRQVPVQAESKEHLKSLLEGRTANGIIFTTMFKFEKGEKALSERRNIVVIADEAHRGQYGFDEKVVFSLNEEGEKEVDYLDNSGGRSRMRHARLMSKGTYEDRRNDKDNPSYSYTLFAAEWRGRNKADRHGKFLKKAIDSGILEFSDIQKIMKMINTGVGYAQVWSYITDLFAANPRGRTWLINNAAEGGMWKPYSIFFRGTRKMIKPNTGPFRFSPRYKKALEK